MRIAALLLVFVLTASACGSDGDSDDESSATEPTPTATATTEPTETPTAEPPPPEPTPGRGEPLTPEELAEGSGGLADYTLIPGPDGSMIEESITFSTTGETITITVDLVTRTAVAYENDEAVCFETLSVAGTSEELPFNGSQVSGTIDLVFDFAEPTQCPDTVQVAMGDPQTVAVAGEVADDSLTGEFDFVDGIPFVAVPA